MSVNKFEAIGIGVSIAAMALLLWVLRVEETGQALSQAVPSENQAAAIVVGRDGDQNAALANALIEGTGVAGEVERLIIDDVVFGNGPEVEVGDTVTAHYIGSLQNGQQFDNSYVKGQPITFTVGEGRVIAGWERGLLGMQVGGQRVLVIPSELAYGEEGAGPIPGDATLVFAIELLSIE